MLRGLPASSQPLLRSADPLAGFVLLDSSIHYEVYYPAHIYSRFHLKPDITTLEPGASITIPSRNLMDSGGSNFYLFNQYSYLRQRITKLRERRPKGGVIVTGTPGIGRIRSILSFSSNSFCRQIRFP